MAYDMSIELKSVCRLVLFKECKVMITIPKRYNIILFKSYFYRIMPHIILNFNP